MNWFKNRPPALVLVRDTLFISFVFIMVGVNQLYFKAGYISDSVLLDIILPISFGWLCAILFVAMYVDVKKIGDKKPFWSFLSFYIVNVGALIFVILGLACFKFNLLSSTTFFLALMLFIMMACIFVLPGSFQQLKTIQQEDPSYQRHPADKFLIPIALVAAISLFAFSMYRLEWKFNSQSAEAFAIAVMIFGLIVFGFRSIVIKFENWRQSK